MDWGSKDWRPSVRIKRVMMGEVRLEDEDQGVQSICRSNITTAAHIICQKVSIDKRRSAIDRVPELMRPYVQEEVVRVWREHYAPSAPDPLRS